MWVSLDEHGDAVGFVDAETYERYAAWDGRDPASPVISEVVEIPSIGLVFVVDPRRRREGLGAATIRAVIAHPSVAHVGFFFACIDHDNLASVRCAERAGLRCRSAEPSFEGMLCYSLERRASL